MLISALASFCLTLATHRPMLYVHVMPWFERKGSELGWHWRMNRSAAEVLSSGDVASHFHPLIGPYDSLDPKVLKLQVNLIKTAGFDGVLADWYGPRDFLDYGMIHQRTVVLFQAATQVGLKIGVVYEDQSAKHAKEAKLTNEGYAELAKQAGESLRKLWMNQSNWIRISGKPAVFVFGPQAFAASDWQNFRKGAGNISLLTLHNPSKSSDGAFDWPIPDKGVDYTDHFVDRSASWTTKVAVAYPRFDDYYREGGASGFAKIPDKNGSTYRETLATALRSHADAVQVATWNDWQEGTQIEPSAEFGLRDLITTQNALRKLDPKFPYAQKDLEKCLAEFRKSSSDHERR